MVVAAQADDRMLLAKMAASPTKCSRDFFLIYSPIHPCGDADRRLTRWVCDRQKPQSSAVPARGDSVEPFLPTTFTSSSWGRPDKTESRIRRLVISRSALCGSPPQMTR